MDDEGVAVLLALINDGAQILSINPYFDLLLKTKRVPLDSTPKGAE